MQFPIADAHCDFLYGAMEYGYDINTLRRDQVIHLPSPAGTIRSSRPRRCSRA